MAVLVFPGGSNITSIHSMWVPQGADIGIFKDEDFCDGWGNCCLDIIKGTIGLCLSGYTWVETVGAQEVHS